MRTYNLKDFLTAPITSVIENEEDYCYETISYNSQRSHSDESGNILSSLKIPLIQRDYAQGRESNTDLRESFIAKLFQHLESGEELKLDFIYGSVDRNSGTVFLPLDGQQRLTTLFLLHWYIIKKNVTRAQIMKRCLQSFPMKPEIHQEDSLKNSQDFV